MINLNIKKSIIFVLVLTLFLPLTVSASQQSGQYYPPSHSDYFQKKFSWQFYSSLGVKQIRFTQFDIEGNKKGTINFEVKENGFKWVDFTCKGNVSVEFLNEAGDVLDSVTRGQGTPYLDNSSCNYKSFVKQSNYDETKRKYKDDTFGKNKKK